MKISSDFSDLLSLLKSKNVEFLLVGGFAVILHSEPRYTKDIDIWVNPSKENAQRVFDALVEFGAPLADLGIGVEDFQKEGYFVQFGREPSRIDILMSVKGLDFTSAWRNRVEMAIGDLLVPTISRADLISAKLEAGRPQDLIDAQKIKTSKREK